MKNLVSESLGELFERIEDIQKNMYKKVKNKIKYMFDLDTNNKISFITCRNNVFKIHTEDFKANSSTLKYLESILYESKLDKYLIFPGKVIKEEYENYCQWDIQPDYFEVFQTITFN